MALTDLQRRLVELDKQKEAVKKFHEDMSETLEALAETEGVGHMFQDPESGSVFKITEPTGQYVFNKPVGYGRTRREGEEKGSLSMKEAKEAGYDL